MELKLGDLIKSKEHQDYYLYSFVQHIKDEPIGYLLVINSDNQSNNIYFFLNRYHSYIFIGNSNILDTDVIYEYTFKNLGENSDFNSQKVKIQKTNFSFNKVNVEYTNKTSYDFSFQKSKNLLSSIFKDTQIKEVLGGFNVFLYEGKTIYFLNRWYHNEFELKYLLDSFYSLYNKKNLSSINNVILYSNGKSDFGNLSLKGLEDRNLNIAFNDYAINNPFVIEFILKDYFFVILVSRNAICIIHDYLNKLEKLDIHEFVFFICFFEILIQLWGKYDTKPKIEDEYIIIGNIKINYFNAIYDLLGEYTEIGLLENYNFKIDDIIKNYSESLNQ